MVQPTPVVVQAVQPLRENILKEEAPLSQPCSKPIKLSSSPEPNQRVTPPPSSNSGTPLSLVTTPSKSPPLSVQHVPPSREPSHTYGGYPHSYPLHPVYPHPHSQNIFSPGSLFAMSQRPPPHHQSVIHATPLGPSGGGGGGGSSSSSSNNEILHQSHLPALVPNKTSPSTPSQAFPPVIPLTPTPIGGMHLSPQVMQSSPTSALPICMSSPRPLSMSSPRPTLSPHLPNIPISVSVPSQSPGSGLPLVVTPHSSPNPMMPPLGTPMQPIHPGGPPGMMSSPMVVPPIETIDPDPDEEEEAPPVIAPRDPSPEPKIDDSECHRSQSAIFLRHWNRGDSNSCSRTDMAFKPVPESKLSRKRDERMRKERDEREKQQKAAQRPDSKPSNDQKGGPYPGMSSEGNMGVRYEGGFTPALRQLSEYARPHTAFSPNVQRSQAGPGPGMGLPPPHGMDPVLHYQLSSGMYQHAARDRLEMELEREKRDQQIREQELRERALHDKLKELELKPGLGRMGQGPVQIDPAWLELHRRYSAAGAAAAAAAGQSPGSLHSGSFLYNPAERERLERLGLAGIQAHMAVAQGGPGSGQNPESQFSSSVERLSAERLHAERMALATDPMLRLQMAGITPEMHPHAHPHAHPHMHHLHPHEYGPAGGHMGGPDPHGHHPLLGPPGAYQRQLQLHPSTSALLGRSYDEQLAHQLSAQAAAHEQLQRQILMERERMSHSGAQMHPGMLAQHEEYLRQQRQRELKLRTLEEAARSARPYDPHGSMDKG